MQGIETSGVSSTDEHGGILLQLIEKEAIVHVIITKLASILQQYQEVELNQVF